MEFSLSELNNVLGDVKNLGEVGEDIFSFKNVSIEFKDGKVTITVVENPIIQNLEIQKSYNFPKIICS